MTDKKKRWARVNELLEKAMAIPDNERQPWLATECGEDAELLAEVLTLLDYDSEQTGGMLASVQSVAADLSDSSDVRYVGEKVGNYRITDKLAEGGMGIVFVAEHDADDFDRKVAVKLLPRHQLDGEASRRFVDERRILAGLSHPNIATLVDGGTLPDGVPYIVMDFIEGETIEQYCATNMLDNDAIIDLVLNLCGAVQYAHNKLVIHRDIKPSNIIVDTRGVPILLDFGIAKLLSPDNDEMLQTRADNRALTPLYASPEQIKGLPITTAADVYGIGLLLYRLLTGKMPYTPTGNTPRELERAILDQTPEKPSTAVLNADDSKISGNRAQRQRRALRGELDTILLTALRKSPERRYQSVAALADDLKRFREHRPITARADSPLYVLRKFVSRHRWPVGFGTSAILAGVAMASYYTSELKIERDTAEQAATFLSDLFAAADPYQKNRDGLTVEALLDSGLEKLDNDTSLAPLVRARLLTTIALVQRNLGDNVQAEELASEALSIVEAEKGTLDAAVIPSLSVLSRVRTTAGDYAQATELALRMLSISERVHGGTSRETAQATSQLSLLAYRSGDIERMGDWARKSYAIRQKVYDADDMAIAIGANGLALYHWQSGDLAEARDYYAESARVQESQTERNDIQYAGLLHNLGLLYNDTGDYEAAAKTYAESVRIRRAAGSERDNYMPLTLYALAHSRARLGDYPSAYRNFLETVPLQVAVAGREEHLVAYALTGFGMMLEEIGEVSSAAVLLEEANRIFDILFEEPHKDQATTWIGLARVAYRTGNFDEGRELLDRALELRRHEGGEDDLSTLRTYSTIGRLEFARGNFDEAASAIGHSLDRLIANDGSQHPFSIEARTWLGRTQSALGNHEQGVLLLREARALGESLFVPDHVENVRRRVWLGEALIASGNAAEGETMANTARSAMADIEQDWQRALQDNPLPPLEDLLTPPAD